MRPPRPAAGWPRCNAPRAVAWLAALLALLALAACEGTEGPRGRNRAVVDWSDDVTAIDLSDLGVDSSGSLPDGDTVYGVSNDSAVVTWTSDGTNYLATVRFKGKRGSVGASGLFPANDLVQLSPLTAEEGGRGETRILRLYFTGDTLYVFERASPREGTALE